MIDGIICRNCPLDLKEAISSVIFASQRCDIDELSEARKQFQAKYGKDFVASALELRPNSGVIPLVCLHLLVINCTIPWKIWKFPRILRYFIIKNYMYDDNSLSNLYIAFFFL